MKDQLHSFKLGAIDDPIFSRKTLGKPLEGLCGFIKNQNDSLKKIELVLDYVLEESILLLAEAISSLTNLRKLVLTLNKESMGGIKFFSGYFRDTLKCEVALELKTSKKWNLENGKYFQGLQNLESFIFTFDIMPPDSGFWFGKFVETLGNLKRLRKFQVITESGEKVKRFDLKFIPVIQEWKWIREMDLVFQSQFSYPFSRPIDPILIRTVDTILKRQAIRCDIMF